MIQYKTLNVQIYNLQLRILKSGIKNNAEVTYGIVTNSTGKNFFKYCW